VNEEYINNSQCPECLRVQGGGGGGGGSTSFPFLVDDRDSPLFLALIMSSRMDLLLLCSSSCLSPHHPKASFPSLDGLWVAASFPLGAVERRRVFLPRDAL